MKKAFLTAIFALIFTNLVNATSYVAYNSATISTSRTSMVILRNNSATNARIDNIEVSCSAATTFYIMKDPGTTVDGAGSSTLTLYSTNFKSTVPTSRLTGSKATAAGANLTTGSDIYSVKLAAGETRVLSLKGAVIGNGDAIAVDATGDGSTVVHVNVSFSE